MPLLVDLLTDSVARTRANAAGESSYHMTFIMTNSKCYVHLMIDKGTAHESDESVHVLRSRMNNLSDRKRT